METETLEIMAFIKDLATAIAAGVASIVAIIGLTTWKRRLKGTTEYDLARRVLEATFSLRDAIRYVRNPIIFSNEEYESLKMVYPDVSEEQLDDEYLRKSAVLNRRWEKVLDANYDFDIVSIEAEVLWENEIKDRLNAIHGRVASLYSAIKLYLTYLPSERPKDKVVAENFRKIAFGHRDEEDKFNNELEMRIINVEEYLRQYLRK
jgi:hypothetical protein